MQENLKKLYLSAIRLLHEPEIISWQERYPQARFMNAARYGLLRACEKFNPSSGANFVRYARHWVRAFVRRCLDKEVHPYSIKCPGHKKSGPHRMSPDAEKWFHGQLSEECKYPVNTFVLHQGRKYFIEWMQFPWYHPEIKETVYCLTSLDGEENLRLRQSEIVVIDHLSIEEKAQLEQFLRAREERFKKRDKEAELCAAKTAQREKEVKQARLYRKWQKSRRRK